MAVVGDNIKGNILNSLALTWGQNLAQLMMTFEST